MNTLNTNAQGIKATAISELRKSLIEVMNGEFPPYEGVRIIQSRVLDCYFMGISADAILFTITQAGQR